MFPRPVVLLALVLGGCASAPRPPEPAPDELGVARELAFSHTWAVLFEDEAEASGYIVEFDAVPEGIVDERLHPPGTVLIQDRDLATIGFITPGGRAYAFDERGRAIDRGADARTRLVASFFGRAEEPAFESTQPGTGSPPR